MGWLKFDMKYWGAELWLVRDWFMMGLYIATIVASSVLTTADYVVGNIFFITFFNLTEVWTFCCRHGYIYIYVIQEQKVAITREQYLSLQKIERCISSEGSLNCSVLIDFWADITLAHVVDLPEIDVANMHYLPRSDQCSLPLSGLEIDVDLCLLAFDFLLNYFDNH